MMSSGRVVVNKNPQIGDVVKCLSGYEAVIIDKRKDIFDLEIVINGETLTVRYHSVYHGSFSPRYLPTLNNGGFLGYPENFTKKDRSCWTDMLLRVNNDNTGIIKLQSYNKASVSEEFKCFEYFLEWMKSSSIYCTQNYHLDKDLLGESKVYSSSTCCLLPPEINLALINVRSSRSNSGLTGVSWCKADKRFVAKIHMNGQHKRIGAFRTSEEAHNAWIKVKGEHLRFLANKYIDLIDHRCYIKLNSFFQERSYRTITSN